MLTRSQQLLGAAVAALLGFGCGDDRGRPAGDAALVDAAVPDVSVPDVAVAAAAVPDATTPDASAADAGSTDATASGTVLWMVRGPGDPGADSLATAIAWDASGGLWLAGFDHASASESAAWVRRLAPSGTPLWRHTVDVPAARDQFRGVAADGSGDAVAVGESNRQLVIQKLGPSGSVAWTVTTQGFDARHGEDVVAGGAGTWVVVGYTLGLEFVVSSRYDAAGTRLQDFGLGTNFCDGSGALRVSRGSSGDLLIGGFTCRSEFGSSSFLRRAAPDLRPRFNLFDPTLGPIQGVAFAGESLLVCAREGLHLYSPSGVLIRRIPLGGQCQRIATTPLGDVITAEVYPDGSARVSSLTLAGVLRWQTSYRGAADLGASPVDLDVASDGTIYVAGSEKTADKQIYFVQALAP